MPSAFADRLIARARRLGHPLCVGLDPHLERIPPLFRQGSMRVNDPATAQTVAAFCRAVLDRAADVAVAVKPQSAFFEALGPAGAAALAGVLAEARQRELPVVLDAKRGDVGSTARAYAAAYLDEEAPLRADALTVSPYLGADALAPFVESAEAAGAGVPGDAAPLWERVAEALVPSVRRLRAPETGWSSLGVVVGATWPEAARRLRELLPAALFLVPGYGAQGGSAKDAAAGFVAGPQGRLEGGIVSASRSILFPRDGQTDDARTWEGAVDEALARAAEELAEATAAGPRDA